MGPIHPRLYPPSQMVWKMLRLPLSLRGYGSLDIGRFAAATSLMPYSHRTKSMSRNMCRRDGLTGGVGRKSSNFVFPLYFPSGRMRCLAKLPV